MRHRKAGKKLGRDSSHRKATLRNLVTSFFEHEEISTTHAKARALRPVAERMISLAKRGDLHARRQALSYIMDKSVTHKLFSQVKDRFLDRQGGYVRILRTGYRRGDRAPLAVVQLVSTPGGKKSVKTAKGSVEGKKKASQKASNKRAISKGEERDTEDTKE
jgi:large subunit ribosomal protein L17